VFLGAIRAGIVPVPLNTLLTSDQYAYVLADCRARVLFVSEALLPCVKDMSGGCRISSMSSCPARSARHKKLLRRTRARERRFATVRRIR
jgi:4-hydroxybenzoate-CoA ligase